MAVGLVISRLKSISLKDNIDVKLGLIEKIFIIASNVARMLRLVSEAQFKITANFV